MINHFMGHTQQFNQQQLHDLLDLSSFNDNDRINNSNDFSISRDKLYLSQKEKTREQSYEDIMKQINIEKLQNIELQKQMEKLRRDYCQKYLQPFYEEFQQLNQENLQLRSQLNRCKKKINQDKLQRYSNRSSIKVKTTNQILHNQKTNTKSQANKAQFRNYVTKNNSPNCILKKKQNKMVESTTNLSQMGYSQIHSPTYHKKRDSLMTERKMQQKDNSLGISVNISILDDKFEQQIIKESISKNCLWQREQQQTKKNIFIKLLQNILLQQRYKENMKYQQFQSQITPPHPSNNQPLFINTLETQIRQTNQKLEILALILNKYQTQIQQMNINLKNVEEWTYKLVQVKGKYIQMQKKCKQLLPLKKQIQEKEEIINKIRQKQLNQQTIQKNIPSIETMLKIISSSKNHKQFKKNSKIYSVYYKQIHELFKYDKQDQNKRFNRIVKVKQTIDNIKEGRTKLYQLIEIYETRISKLQDKINRLKKNQQNR